MDADAQHGHDAGVLQGVQHAGLLPKLREATTGVCRLQVPQHGVYSPKAKRNMRVTQICGIVMMTLEQDRQQAVSFVSVKQFKTVQKNRVNFCMNQREHVDPDEDDKTCSVKANQ